MPTVCCGSERCKLATKMRNVIRKLFYCGAISLLVGPWVFASLPEESFLSMLLSAAVYMVWGWLFIFCGFAMIAPSSIWKCEVSDNHTRAFIEGEVSSSSLIYEDVPSRGVVVDSPPSYESWATTPLPSSVPTPPPKYEDAVNSLFYIYGRLPSHRQTTPVCPVHVPADETSSESVRLPRSAQQWHYLQWPEPRVWPLRQPLRADISYI